MNQVRWNIAVSPATDQSLRMFLASQGGGRKGDLTRLIEEAVRAHILALSAEAVKAANFGMDENELDALVVYLRCRPQARTGFQRGQGADQKRDEARRLGCTQQEEGRWGQR